MNDAPTLYRRFAFTATVLSLIAALLRTPALCLFFDRTVGYCDPNAFSTLLYIVIALFLLACAAYAILAAKCEKKQQIALAPDVTSQASILRIASLLTSLVFLVVAVWEIASATTISYPALLRLLGAALAMIYFAARNKQVLMWLGLGVHVYCIFVLVTEYFDWTIPMNSPLKIMQQTAMIALLLFITVELNHLNNTRRSIRYTVCAALAAFFGCANGLSLIAAYLAGGIVRTDILFHSLPALAIALYAIARLFTPHTVNITAEDLKAPNIADEGQQPTGEASEQAPPVPDAPDTQPPETTSEEED